MINNIHYPRMEDSWVYSVEEKARPAWRSTKKSSKSDYIHTDIYIINIWIDCTAEGSLNVFGSETEGCQVSGP